VDLPEPMKPVRTMRRGGTELVEASTALVYRFAVWSRLRFRIGGGLRQGGLGFVVSQVPKAGPGPSAHVL